MILAIAIIVYIVGSVAACKVFGEHHYDEVKDVNKLAGFFLVLSVIGVALRMDSVSEVVLFQQLAPMAQYSFIAAMILWTYLVYVRLKKEA